MRLLFVSGTATGGSAVSTRELAEALAARGHTVGVVTRRRERPRSGLVARGRYGVGAATRFSARVSRALRRLRATTVGAATVEHGVAKWVTAAPERVLAELCESLTPDVVVVGSVARNPWASMRATLHDRGIASVLYVREAATLEHVPVTRLRPDLVVTNSDHLAASVEAFGLPVTMVPSIIDFDRCTVDSTGAVVLFVNPIESRGLSIALELARVNPDIPFVFQRSWPLDDRDERGLERRVAGHPNVELRNYESDPARVYRDARVLLLPYWVDQRPRVVVEAQWNGIPVLASDLAGHREAVGEGGLFVDLAAAPEAWNAALHALWDDGETATSLRRAARAHAAASGQDADRVAERFEAAVATLVAGHGVG